MASDTQTEICLDVAVDHRIRRLFKPVPSYVTEPSTHVSRIEAEGRSLQLPRAEIQVTAQLAGPPVKGGIAVMLQQPRHNHPFAEGLDAVIEDCESLRALDNIFAVVSRGTLDLRKDITVVDLLPYVSGKPNEIDDARLKDAFRTSVAAVCDKEPDVLLCAGKISIPFARAKKVKGSSYMFESIGLAEQFGRIPKWPVTAMVRHKGQRGFVAVPKVNGFHPSHAMNYHSHVSLLRQLQILIGAEVCGMYRSDWEESAWMDELRHRCQVHSSRTATSPTRSPAPASPGQNEARRNSTKYMPEYQELYSEALLDIQNCLARLISPSKQADPSLGERYEALLNSSLSEKCNDASLILRQMHRLHRRGWSESIAWKNEAALSKAATDTYHLAAKLAGAAKRPKDAPFAGTLRRDLGRILDRVTVVQPNRKYELDLGGAAKAFLDLAVDVETELLDLLLEKEAALDAQGQEDLLSGLLRGISLGPKAAVTVAPVAVGASSS